MKTLKIDKLNVALRHLLSACQLYFDDADPVPIHTLACTAHDLLCDMRKNKGAKSIFFDEMQKNVRPEFQEKFSKLVKKTRNFFQHAKGSTATKVIEFNPDETTLILLDACFLYRAMTGRDHYLLRAYNFWVAMKEPQLFLLGKEKEAELSELTKKLKSVTKRDFINFFTIKNV